jgi:hypothetical protein
MKAKLCLSSIRLSAFLAVLGSIMLCGCASTPVRPTQYPSSAKGWHGIDLVEFLQEFHLQDYSQLVLEPLDTSATKLPPKDENTYEPAVTLVKKADAIVLTEVERTVKDNIAVSAKKPGDSLLEKTLLLRTKLDEVNPGSRAARYWVGFGAGSAWVKINGEIVDAKTSNVLLKFEQRRVAAMGMFGGDYDRMLNDCVVEIGRDTGRLLSLFKTP